jgi:Family of unknown function (DUF6445)
VAEVVIDFNDAATVEVTHVGRRGIPVSRISNVFRDPGAVAALGYAQSYSRDGGNFYPGMRVPTPSGFSASFRVWVGRILQCEFTRDASYFSVVTTGSADLLPIQRIPHYDSTDPTLSAAVIYLCDSRFGGTSFYRHRKTGYEEITEDNRKNYQLALDNELRLHGPPKREYVNGDTPLFERIYSNALQFNSAIVYPGRMLHAGNIPPVFTSPRSKDEWRLTITSLLFS